MKKLTKRFSLLEVLVSLSIFSIMILGVMEYMNSQFRFIDTNKSKKFALLKANQILNELRTYVEDSGETSGIADTLDRLHNLIPHPLLTIQPLAESSQTEYDIVLSNNEKTSGGTHVSTWRYLRTVGIAPIGIGGTRQVTVKIYRGKDFRDFPANDLVSPIGGEYPKPIISLIAVLPTVGDLDFESQQVFDFYNIAIENIPGWWVHMGDLFPVAQNALKYVDSVNEGMTIRNHWITKLGYGRNPFYAPYMNVNKDSRQPSENAYYYPGKMPNGFLRNEYYVPTLMKGHMQSDVNHPSSDITYINGYYPYFNSELTAMTGSSTPSSWDAYNPHPYALADYLNNPMRYSDMREIYDLRNYEAKRSWYHKNIDRNPEKNPGLGEISREDNPDFKNVENLFMRIGVGEEMPWALMLDEMSMKSELYRNGIFLNLHGELLPMPPTRNFSDPAIATMGKNIKLPFTPLEAGYDPGRYTYFRAVAHPERIRYHKYNNMGLAGASDETGNADLQNPIYRVYGFLSEPVNSGAWRSLGANAADGNSGVKKQRLDDKEEAPISMLVRFHRSKHIDGGTNKDFAAWREVLMVAAETMRKDRYMSFYEGGTVDLNGRSVSYGTHYKGADILAGNINVPTEANEGWGYLNHSSLPTDPNASLFISTDNLKRKGLGVEPVGLKYAPYFYLDKSLEPLNDTWNNLMYLHQRASEKIYYVTADNVNPDTLDIGLNADYSINPTVPANNIAKAAGDHAPSVSIATDIINSGTVTARLTNPAGWTPHFIGVKKGASLASQLDKGESEWFAVESSGGVITSASSNSFGKMKFWTGASYDDTSASYHSFPRRNNLRSLNAYSTDSLLGEDSLDYWHFALVGPDATSNRYEMLYLSDKNWVPILNKLNFPNVKKAWDDRMDWRLTGDIQIDLFANKSAATMQTMYNGIKNTGKFYLTNHQDNAALSSYVMMTTVVPGKATGSSAFQPSVGMIINGRRVTHILNELDATDPFVASAFLNNSWTDVRFFLVQIDSPYGVNGTSIAGAELIIPKADKTLNIADLGGGVYDIEIALFEPKAGMKVYNQTGTEMRTIRSVTNFVESSVPSVSTSNATARIHLDSAFSALPTKMYLLATPAIQTKPLFDEAKPSALVTPIKKGFVLYANTKAELDGYVVSTNPGNPNYVKYGFVKTAAGSDDYHSSRLAYKYHFVGGSGSWQQIGTLGRKLDYSASDPHWAKVPCYDRMWAEVEYVFVHTDKYNKWKSDEDIIGNNKTFEGDHCLLITLHNTPMTTAPEVVAPANVLLNGNAVKNGFSGGLMRAIGTADFATDRRLYDLEYIPAPIRTNHKPDGTNTGNAATTFDLLVNDKVAKNTARWRIKLPSITQLTESRNVAATLSKNITRSADTVNYFSTYVGSQEMKAAFLPLKVETRIGGITSGKFTGFSFGDLSVAVGVNTNLTGAGAPASVTVANGYFEDVSRDIADWTQWARISKSNGLVYEDLRTVNNSRSFSWTVNNIAEYPLIKDDVNIPFSEKFQTYGDARHMPYMDLKDTATGTNQGYNWYFANSTGTKNWTDYTGYGKIKTSYGTGGGGPYEADIPKMFMWLREAMLNSNTIWCSITGYSYYYVGLGNEIGYDSTNGFPNSIPVSLKAWGAGGDGYEDTIISSIIGIRNRDNTWEARNFIGELFPEWGYNNFTSELAGGQLPTSTASSASHFYRFDRQNSLYKEIVGLNCMRRTQTRGGTSLLNVETGANLKFNHSSQGDGNMGTISTEKIDMMNNALKIRLDPSVFSNRPWIINDGGNQPHEWTDYAAMRTTSLLVNKTTTSANDVMDMIIYRDSGNRIASGLLEIHDPLTTKARESRKRALFLINGLSQMNLSGPNSISTFSVMSLFYGYLRGGSKWLSTNIAPSSGTTVVATTEPNFFRQLPKINIIAPKITFPITDPICQIKWTLEWKRWDGKPYWGTSDNPADVNHWKSEYADPIPDGSIFFRVIFAEAPHSSTNDWRYVNYPNVKTSAGLTFDKLIGDNDTYNGSLLDAVEIDGNAVYADSDTPGRELPMGADVGSYAYRLDWNITGLKLKTAYAFRVECHRRQHTMYYIDPIDGVEKAYEFNNTAVQEAKDQRAYIHSHYSFQQGLMIIEDL